MTREDFILLIEDMEYAWHHGADRVRDRKLYYRLRDEILELVDEYPNFAPIARDAGLPV